jgi:hypothetical protein
MIGSICSFLGFSTTAAPELSPPTPLSDDWVYPSSEAAEDFSKSIIVRPENNQRSFPHIVQDIALLANALNANLPVPADKIVADLQGENGLLQPFKDGSALKILGELKARNSQSLIPLVVTLIRSFNNLEKSKHIESRDTAAMKAFSYQMKLLTNIDKNSPIFTLASLALNSPQTLQSEEFIDLSILQIDSQQGLTLVSSASKESLAKCASQVDHTEVADVLKKLLTAMDETDLLKQLPTSNLVQLQYLFMQLFSNYAKLLNNSSEGLQPIVLTLQSIITGFREHLNTQAHDWTYINPSHLAKVGKSLEEIGYTEMDQARDIADSLKAVKPLLEQIFPTVCNPEVSNLTPLDTSFEKDGVVLYEGSNEELVVVFSGADNFWATQNPLAERIRCPGVPGTMLQCVYNVINDKMKNAENLLTRHVQSIKKTIVLTGFGIDGAAAEFVAARLAPKYTNQAIISAAIGSPSYLNYDAKHALLRNNKNLSNYQFQLQQDLAVDFNTRMAKALGNHLVTPLGVRIPVYCADLFLTDRINQNHDKQIYSANLPNALDFAISTYDNYAGLKNDFNAAAAQHYQPDLQKRRVEHLRPITINALGDNGNPQ